MTADLADPCGREVVFRVVAEEEGKFVQCRRKGPGKVGEGRTMVGALEALGDGSGATQR